MDIRLELLSGAICDAVRENMTTLTIDANQIVDSKATKILGEIKAVIHNNNLDDFEMVDEIVSIFCKYNIDIGGCHDF
ncbi:MAG: hypothetical protein IJ304_05455 [Clostridia bacterium]|nr:hypothetical protein [Clostridia bacterium]